MWLAGDLEVPGSIFGGDGGDARYPNERTFGGLLLLHVTEVGFPDPFCYTYKHRDRVGNRRILYALTTNAITRQI